MKKTLVFFLFYLLLPGCKSSNSTNTAVNQIQLLFEAKSGTSTTGKGSFTEKNGQVTFSASFIGLEPGLHAIHIHEKADCSAADGSSAGGHWNPTFKNHGEWGSSTYHKGDIGNIKADKNGRANITFTTNEWCIGCQDETKNIIGKSVIIHLNPDDFTTQPTGNAGGRIACAAIIR